jgi:hypothetical protein
MFLVGGFFLLGMSFALAGAYMLLFRSANAGEVKLLAEQTTHLAQKGIAEDVAGLVGNASDLLNSVNQMVRTQAGVGVFLVIAGGVMMVISCWIAIPHI